MRPLLTPDRPEAAPFQGPPLSLISEEGGGISLFYGHPDLFALSSLMAAWRLAQGEAVLFLDGNNRFDPYPLVRLAKERGHNPEAFLSALFVSRAFTCHQMGSLVFQQLQSGLSTHQARLVILADPLATFYDENVPYIEAKNLLMHLLTALQQLAPGRIFVVLAPYPKTSSGRRVFFLSHLKSAAKRIFRVHREAETRRTFSISEEKPGTGTWQGVFQYRPMPASRFA